MNARTIFWRLAMLGATALSAAWPVSAHHSYAMFENTRRATVVGTIAKVQWENPHISVWAYVPSPQASSGYALYAFESGGVNLMARNGWTKETFKQGEKVTIEFFPLKDGRPGGAFIQALHADGSITRGDPLSTANKDGDEK